MCRPQVPPTLRTRAIFEQTNFCRQSLSYCRQSLSTVDKVCHLVVTADELVRMQTKFVSSGSADKVCLHRKSWQTNSADKLCLQKIRQNLAKMQTNPADKLCLQKIRRKLGQNADKSCRQTLSAKNPPKTGPKCRQILQTNLVKTENCRQLQKKCRQSLSSIVRKGLSILDKLCLYPKILELALAGTVVVVGGGGSGPLRQEEGRMKNQFAF